MSPTKAKPVRPKRDRNRGLALKLARLKLDLEQAQVGLYWPTGPVSKQRVSRVEAGATPEAVTQYRQALAAAKVAARAGGEPA